MKTLFNALVLLALLLSVSACYPVLKVVYGFKNPSPTTDSAVEANAEQLFGTNYEQYRPKSDTAYATLIKNYEIGVPGILFFDEAGQGVSLNADTLNSCTADAESLIAQLRDLDRLPKIEYSKWEVDELLDRITPAASDSIRPMYDAEYSIRIFWASFAGKKLNKEKPKAWLATYESLDDNFRSRIDVKIINLDPLEEMGLAVR